MSLVAKRRGADTWQVLLPELLKTAGSGPVATEMVGNLFCPEAGVLQLCFVHWQPNIGVKVQTSSRKSCAQLSFACTLHCVRWRTILLTVPYSHLLGVTAGGSQYLPGTWGPFRPKAIALYFPAASLHSRWAFRCSSVTHRTCLSTAGVLGAEFCDRGYHLLCG